MSFILSFIFLSIISCSPHIIPIEYSQISGAYNIEYKIGSPSQTKFFEINLNIPFNFASNNLYRKHQSTTVMIYESGEESIETQKGKYEHLSDNLIIQSINETITSKDFHFYNFEGYYDIYDSISLANKHKDLNFSLVHNLYNNKLIDKLQFGMINTGYKQGMLYLGGFPNNTIFNKNNFTCKINNSYSSWAFNINKVIVGNDQYDNDQIAYLQGNDRRILVPSKFFNFLKEKIFDSYVKNETCKFREILRYHFYECKYEHTNYFPNISYTIDNFTFQIDYHLLYRVIEYDNNTFRQFLIEENVFEPDKWAFGIPFFTKFPVLFDYEKETLTFYYDDVSSFGKWKKTIKWIFYISISIIGIFGISNGIYFKSVYN